MTANDHLDTSQQELLQFRRERSRLERKYHNLETIHARQSATLAALKAEKNETIASLSRATEELSGRLASLLRYYEDQLDRYARRLCVAALRSDTLAELAAARTRRSNTALAGGPLIPRLAPRREGAHRPAHQRKRLVSLVSESGIFSPNWYRQTYPDCQTLDDKAALAHFVEHGLLEDRDPHPLFSAWWTRRQNMCPADAAPFIAFLHGVAARPHPLFDPEFYLAANSDVRGAGTNALQHYVRFGCLEGRTPHPLFDPAWYAARRGPASVPDLLLDYLETPGAADADPHPLFRTDHYRAQDPGCGSASPLLHYVVSGWERGLSPHPLFQPAFYLATNPDVADAKLEPLEHFLAYGAAQLRRPHPLFDTAGYLKANPDVAEAGYNPLAHYVRFGVAENRPPGPSFPLRAIAEAFPDVRPGTCEPVELLLRGEGLRLDLPRSELHAPAGNHQPPGLPALLRQYVEGRHGAGALPALEELMQLVATFEHEPIRFKASAEAAALTRRARKLAAGLPETVDISIIIPVHNGLVHSLVCVASILQSATPRTYEILIADDASTDGTEALFSSLGARVRLVRQARNVGFLENCNLAAAAARGRFLVFLNNDTIVLPGWLDALLQTFEDDPTVGLAGSKLLNLDGSLQEAGGVLWNDGQAWNFGRGSNPASPEFNYVKDVDYVSGASLAIPEPLWTRLGGFDPAYSPAYCEDSDLALRVRAAGLRTVYQPFSELIHHEGRSHGRDIAGGIKAYQVKNQRKLVARWSETLQRENAPPGQDVLVARDRSRARPHVVVVDHYVPQWDRDAGSRTMLHFIRAFVAQGFHVCFWPDNLHRDPIYTDPLQRLGVEVIYGPEFDGRFETWLAERAPWTRYVLLSRPHIARHYIASVQRFPDIKLMYYGHDLHWQRLLDKHRLTGRAEDLIASEQVRVEEDRIAQASHVVLYPSEAECAEVRRSVEPGTLVSPVPAWIFDEADLETGQARIAGPDVDDPFALLFVGGFDHPPNGDGIIWFATEVLPHLLQTDPRFSVTVAGSNPGGEIRALASPRMLVTGHVSDAVLAGHYARAGCAIVPLRYGAGVKGKVIEAFSKGVPVISTSVGLQGIPSSACFALVADEPEAFAAAIMRAARDRVLANTRAAEALDFVRAQYSARAFATALDRVLPKECSRPAGPNDNAPKKRPPSRQANRNGKADISTLEDQ